MLSMMPLLPPSNTAVFEFNSESKKKKILYEGPQNLFGSCMIYMATEAVGFVCLPITCVTLE